MPEMVEPLRNALFGKKETEVFDAGFTWEEMNRDIERREDAVWEKEDKIEKKEKRYWRYLYKADKSEGWNEEKWLRQAHDEREKMERLASQKVKLMEELDVLLDLRSLAEDALAVEESPRSEFEIDLAEIDAESLEDAVRDVKKAREDKRDKIEDLRTEIESMRDDVAGRYEEERQILKGAKEVQGDEISFDEMLPESHTSIKDRDEQLQEDLERVTVKVDESEHD